jgi:Protein of unknown function (DUF2809)
MQYHYNMLQFKKSYFLLSLLFFAIELYIGFYVNDNFIRPYVGDFLVVILIYCFLRSFLNIPKKTTALLVLLFAYAVEIAQFFDIVAWLGLTGNRPAEVLIGTSFSWEDMLAYTLGVALASCADGYFSKKNISN